MKAWKELKLLPREVWILSIATLVNRTGTMVLPFLMLYLTRAMGLHAENAAAVLGIYGLVSMIVAPISGALCDRIGPLRILVGGLVLSGITLLAFPLAATYTQILFATFAFSVFNEASRPASMTLIPEYVGPDLQKQAFALNRLATNLGMSISPVLGGILAESDFGLIFRVDGITTILAVLVLLLPGFGLKSRPPKTTEALPATESGQASRLWSSLKDPAFLAFLFATVPVGITFFQSNSTLPLSLVRDHGLSPSEFGALMAINTVLIVLTEVPLNSATSHWPLSRAMAWGCMFSGIGFGALAFAQSARAIGLAIVIWTVGEMMLFPAMSAYISEVAAPGRRGEYMGIFSMTFSATFMAGPWLGTRILETQGSAALWGTMFAFGTLSAILMGRLSLRR